MDGFRVMKWWRRKKLARFAHGMGGAFTETAVPSALRAHTVIATTHDSEISTYRLRVERPASAQYRRELPQTVVEALQRGDRRVIVDCATWSQLDLIVLSALVNCARVCCDAGAEFELENLECTMRSRIVALGLAERLRLHT